MSARDDFREAVFKRDNHKCVICGAPAKDAHHIIERRLFPDGGYELDNGASLCEEHHLAAESTELTCEAVREAAHIRTVVLPPDLYSDTRYDKWGNPFIDDYRRARGPLFDDPSVQRIIKGEFSQYVKYPRTFHLPWSPGGTKDDRFLQSVDAWIGTEVVITEKMDGENTTFYRDYIHGRSLEYGPHPSRDRVKAFHAQIAHDIPEGWRVCVENLYARHSIAYESLETYFPVFSVWDENTCLSWAGTELWVELLGMQTVPLLWRGVVESRGQLERITIQLQEEGREGVVVRPAAEFRSRDFSTVVGKWVRRDHVQTSHHWRFEQVVPNKLKE